MPKMKGNLGDTKTMNMRNCFSFNVSSESMSIGGIVCIRCLIVYTAAI